MTAREEVAAVLGDLEVHDDRTSRTPGDNVAVDARLGADVGAGRRAPLYRLWENGRALVVTAREHRLPGFRRACRALESEGWPVVRRESGGTVVPHGPGILEASLLIPQQRLTARALESVYEMLCRPVIRALAELGVVADFGEVEGSFCDGRFNLVAGERKIAGTSQRWRGGLPPASRPDGYVLAHLVLFVEADMEAATGAVNRFYAVAGAEDRFEPAAHVTVAECLARTGGVVAGLVGPPRAGLTDRVRAMIARAAGAPEASGAPGDLP